jgi:hypothetical protein
VHQDKRQGLVQVLHSLALSLACVILDTAGKCLDYLLKQLHWLGDSSCMYLWDTRVIQDAHCKALQASTQEILNLLVARPTDIIQNALMSEGTVNGNIGKYHNMTWIKQLIFIIKYQFTTEFLFYSFLFSSFALDQNHLIFWHHGHPTMPLPNVWTNMLCTQILYFLMSTPTLNTPSSQAANMRFLVVLTI